MLVLSRKRQQQIKIGEQITVTILRVQGNTVRVGIEAPRDIRVVRGELPAGAPGGEAPADEPAVEIGLAETPVAAAAGAGEEAGESLDEAASAIAAAAGGPPTVLAAHMPWRRLRRRFGAGPLAAIIASTNSPSRAASSGKLAELAGCHA
jgi:carbon storage regulator CsrA